MIAPGLGLWGQQIHTVRTRVGHVATPLLAVVFISVLLLVRVANNGCIEGSKLFFLLSGESSSLAHTAEV